MASLIYVYAAMNSGKSSQALQVAFNYKERGMDVIMLKPSIDTRDGNTISSRIGLSAPCTLVSKDDTLYGVVYEQAKEGTACVIVDEAQFLTELQVKQLASVVDLMGLPVMCYGLRTDFQGNLFEGSKALFEHADEIRELRTICWCGKKATHVLRLDANGNAVRDGAQVQIGGNDSYVSLCRKHWRQGMTYADSEIVPVSTNS